jgi:hypothetical protein
VDGTPLHYVYSNMKAWLKNPPEDLHLTGITGIFKLFQIFLFYSVSLHLTGITGSVERSSTTPFHYVERTPFRFVDGTPLHYVYSNRDGREKEISKPCI